MANLYCKPSDVYDDLGEDGVDLRLSDGGTGTGQTVTVRLDAAAGDTALAVTALTQPLLAGTTLQFDGGGLGAVQEAQLSLVGQVGDSTLTVNPLSGAVPATASAVDDGNNLALAKRLVKACGYATNQVLMYCGGRYDDSQLYANATGNPPGSVNRWATALAKRWLCRRRGQSAPASVQEDAEFTLEELRQVQRSMLSVERVGTRTSGWPFITNGTVDIRYQVAKARVQPQLSEATPTQYAQYIDWDSIFYFDLEW